MKDCLGLAMEFQAKKLDNDGVGGHQPPGGNNNAFQDHDKQVATIFGGLTSAESRREQKLTARRVLAVNAEDAVANPSYHP